MAQRQRICNPPGNASFAVDPFEKPDHHQPEILTRSQRRPPQLLVIELTAAPFAETVKALPLQHFVQTLVDRVSGHFWQFIPVPQRFLPLALFACAHGHTQFYAETFSDGNDFRHGLLALRREWELTGSETAKQDLINYNTDDCAALEVVVQTLLQLIPKDDASPTALLHPNAVHVDSLKPQTPHRLGPVNFALPELDQINKCAYWDYQRDRIYIRSNPLLRRVARRKQRQKRRRILPVNATVSPSRP